MIINELNNTYQVNQTKQFNPQIKLEEEGIKKCFDFALNMTFGKKGEHRNIRSGGNKKRTGAEIFADTFQGKIAELGFYEFYNNKDGIKISKPDTTVFPLGKWDSADFYMNGSLVAIKSTKRYGNLLLLETKDWDENGNYIPNKGIGNEQFDFFYLVRVSSSCTDVLKSNKMLYSKRFSSQLVFAEILKKEWLVEITGYITYDDFVNDIILNEQIIPQNAVLNGHTIMDASNYYVESGQLRFVEE